MSRALGAAFLNHQVEQLEKTVGPGSGNWRDHRRTQPRTEMPGKVIRRKDGDGVEIDGGDGRVRRREDARPQKDADIVVVDASVLVHALHHLKKWCRDGREEVVIIPLEALNTLDLLKKGTSAVAQRARAASRILEAQVGTNRRIRVQRDDAFVLWDSIFADQAPGVNPGASPEWVRRTICCARWEVEHAPEEVQVAKPRVVLAVSQAAESLYPGSEASASPVPLPAPQANRYEPRSAGALISAWARKAGIQLLELPPPPPPPGPTPNGAVKEAPAGRRSGEGRRSPEDGRRGGAPGGGRGRRVHSRNGSDGVSNARPPSSSGLVERPPAVMAMMEAIAQPSRVVRVLARGEKLEPDS